jgi:hypothetical protein
LLSSFNRFPESAGFGIRGCQSAEQDRDLAVRQGASTLRQLHRCRAIAVRRLAVGG